MNSSCWRETLKSDSWKMGTFVWRRSMDIRAMRREQQTYFGMNSKFHFFFFTECIRYIDMNIMVVWIVRVGARMLQEWNRVLLMLKIPWIYLSVRGFNRCFWWLNRNDSWTNRMDWTSKNSRASFTIRRLSEEIRPVDLSEKDSVHLQCRRYS